MIDVGIRRRQQVFTLVFWVTALSALYHVFFQDAQVLGTLASLGVGIVLGHLLFHRITNLAWDDDKGMVVPKMDLAGAVFLLLFVVVVLIGDAPFVTEFVDASTVSAAASSFAAGIMIGQLGSIQRKIHAIIGPAASQRRAYSSRVDIDAPADQVWQVVTDFASYKSWNPLLSNVKGDLVVGGKLRVHASFIPIPLNATVLTADKPHEFKWEDHVPFNLLTPVFSVHLLPLADDRTRVIIQESFSGPLLGMAGRRLDRQMPPLYDAMAKALAQQVEKNKTAT
ncbi:SRPBCC domain-containing protein [bacterium]|nr:SRPBCC domain-containing protein [bacterium]